MKIKFLFLLVCLMTLLKPVHASYRDKITTESDLQAVIDKVINTFRPRLEEQGRRFTIERDQYNPNISFKTFRKSTKESGILISGNAQRFAGATSDAIAFAICTQLGSLIGGAPYQRVTGGFGAVNGQAIYWASLKCFRKVFENDFNYMGDTTNPEIRKKCRATWGYKNRDNEAVQLCERTAQAGLDLAKISADYVNSNASILNKDKKIVFLTNTQNLLPQCKLDTIMAGALCKKDVSSQVSFYNDGQGVCTRKSLQNKEGVRPLCWYRPQRQDLYRYEKPLDIKQNLLNYLIKGNLEVVREALDNEHFRQNNRVAGSPNSALHNAVILRDKAMVKLLLQYEGASVNFNNPKDIFNEAFSPIALAVKKNYPEILKMLLDVQNPFLWSKDKNGKSLVDLINTLPDSESVSLLRNIFSTAKLRKNLVSLAKENRLDDIKKVFAADRYYYNDPLDKWEAIKVAIRENHNEVAKFILQRAYLKYEGKDLLEIALKSNNQGLADFIKTEIERERVQSSLNYSIENKLDLDSKFESLIQSPLVSMNANFNFRIKHNDYDSPLTYGHLLTVSLFKNNFEKFKKVLKHKDINVDSSSNRARSLLNQIHRISEKQFSYIDKEHKKLIGKNLSEFLHHSNQLTTRKGIYLSIVYENIEDVESILTSASRKMINQDRFKYFTKTSDEIRRRLVHSDKFDIHERQDEIDSESILGLAIKANDIDLAIELMTIRDVDINGTTTCYLEDCRYTSTLATNPFGHALKSGDQGLINFFMDRDDLLFNGTFNTPLSAAVESNNIDTLEMILEDSRLNRNNVRILSKIVHRENYKMLKLVLKSKYKLIFSKWELEYAIEVAQKNKLKKFERYLKRALRKRY